MTGSNKVFLDTSIYIYYIERNPIYYENVKNMLNKLYNDGKQFVTSVITFEEYAMVPIRESNMNLIAEFEHF